MTDETFPHEIWADLAHWIEGPAASDLRAQGYMKYIRADRIEELEAKLAKAVDGLRQCEAEIDDYIRHEYPGDHPVQARYRKRDFDANPARTTLTELKGGKDE